MVLMVFSSPPPATVMEDTKGWGWGASGGETIESLIRRSCPWNTNFQTRGLPHKLTFIYLSVRDKKIDILIAIFVISKHCIKQFKPRPWMLTKKPLKNTRKKKNLPNTLRFSSKAFHNFKQLLSILCWFQYYVAFKMHKLTCIFQDMRWVDTKLGDSYCHCWYSQSPSIILGFRLFYWILADARALPCSCHMSESCHILFPLCCFVRRNLGLLEHLSYF